MKATEAKLLDFLKKSPQFVIPIYQRTYTRGGLRCGPHNAQSVEEGHAGPGRWELVPGNPDSGTTAADHRPSCDVSGRRSGRVGEAHSAS